MLMRRCMPPEKVSSRSLARSRRPTSSKHFVHALGSAPRRPSRTSGPRTQVLAGARAAVYRAISCGTTPMARLTASGAVAGPSARRSAAVAAGRRQQADEHGDGRGLARAVGAEQAEDLAAPHAKTQRLHGDSLAKCFMEFIGNQNEIRHMHLPRRQQSRRSSPPDTNYYRVVGCLGEVPEVTRRSWRGHDRTLGASTSTK